MQATFPYLNVWLGVAMVYNAATFRQEVHARLVWSNDTVHYRCAAPGPAGPLLLLPWRS